MILETYLNENRLLEVNQIEFDKMINENTYYLTEGFTDTIKSIGNKLWEAIKKIFEKIKNAIKRIKEKTVDKIINYFKSKIHKKKAEAEADKVIKTVEQSIKDTIDEDNNTNDITDDNMYDNTDDNNEIPSTQNTSSTNTSAAENIKKTTVVKVLDIHNKFDFNRIKKLDSKISDFTDLFEDKIYNYITIFSNNKEPEDTEFKTENLIKIFDNKKVEIINDLFKIEEYDEDMTVDDSIEISELRLKYKNIFDNKLKNIYVELNFETFEKGKDRYIKDIEDGINQYIESLTKISGQLKMTSREYDKSEKKAKEMLKFIKDNIKGYSNEVVDKFKSNLIRLYAEVAKCTNKIFAILNNKLIVESETLYKIPYFKIEER